MEYLPTIVVLVILAVVIFFAARSVYRSKKQGGCAGCSGSCGKSACHCDKKLK